MTSTSCKGHSSTTYRCPHCIIRHKLTVFWDVTSCSLVKVCGQFGRNTVPIFIVEQTSSKDFYQTTSAKPR
jgi:hypothetical protein